MTGGFIIKKASYYRENLTFISFCRFYLNGLVALGLFWGCNCHYCRFYLHFSSMVVVFTFFSRFTGDICIYRY